MKYTNKKDIYTNIKVGMKIGYRTFVKKGLIKTGIVKELINCQCDTLKECNMLIGIDDKKPRCFGFGDFTGIEYIEDIEFIAEEEFKI